MIPLLLKRPDKAYIPAKCSISSQSLEKQQHYAVLARRIELGHTDSDSPLSHSSDYLALVKLYQIIPSREGITRDDLQAWGVHPPINLNTATTLTRSMRSSSRLLPCEWSSETWNRLTHLHFPQDRGHRFISGGGQSGVSTDYSAVPVWDPKV